MENEQTRKGTMGTRTWQINPEASEQQSAPSPVEPEKTAALGTSGAEPAAPETTPGGESAPAEGTTENAPENALPAPSLPPAAPSPEADSIDAIAGTSSTPLPALNTPGEAPVRAEESDVLAAFNQAAQALNPPPASPTASAEPEAAPASTTQAPEALPSLPEQHTKEQAESELSEKSAQGPASAAPAKTAPPVAVPDTKPSPTAVPVAAPSPEAAAPTAPLQPVAQSVASNGQTAPQETTPVAPHPERVSTLPPRAASRHHSEAPGENAAHSEQAAPEARIPGRASLFTTNSQPQNTRSLAQDLAAEHRTGSLPAVKPAAAPASPVTPTPAGGSANGNEPAAPTAPTWSQIESDTIAPGAGHLANSLERTMVDGATLLPEPLPRTGAHLWSLLWGLILGPLSWFMVVNTGAMVYALGGETALGGLQILRLACAAISLWALVMLARWSTLGLWVNGVICTALGGLGVFAPALAHKLIDPILGGLENTTDFTGFLSPLPGALYRALQLSLQSGLFLFWGLALISLALGAHGARRAGRRDYLAKRQREKKQAGQQA